MNLPEYSQHEIVVQPLWEVSDGEISGVISVVRALGAQITDVALNEYVLHGSLLGGEPASVINEPDYIRLPLKPDHPMTGLIYHSAVLLNLCFEAQFEFGENIIVLGDGYRQQLFQKLSRIFGVHLFTEPELTDSTTKNFDALVIISQNHNHQTLGQGLDLLRPRARIISLTRWPIEKYWSVFFQKNLQLRFPFSTGSTLKNLNEQYHQIPEAYVTGTSKRNMSRLLEWLSAGKLTFENIDTVDLKIRNFG